MKWIIITLYCIFVAAIGNMATCAQDTTVLHAGASSYETAH